jgi:hypothetical protein
LLFPMLQKNLFVSFISLKKLDNHISELFNL